MVKRTSAIILGLLLTTQAQAATTFSNLPAATVPLDGTEVVPMDQGSSTVKAPSARVGQPVQTNCGAMATPFQFQQCIDTSGGTPYVLKEYIGTTWWPIFTLSSTSGPGLTLSSLEQIPARTILGNTSGSTAAVTAGFGTQGSTNTVATTSGSFTSGHVIKADASGNFVDGGTPASGLGTVTSVALSVPAASILGVSGSPITTSGTISLTTTGTSGGLPYFSSSSQLGSSASITGIVKNAGASGPSAAVAGTDYAAATTGSANTPLFNDGAGGFTNGTRSGNTTKVATVSGSPVSPSAAVFDASGNIVAGGTLVKISTQTASTSSSLDFTSLGSTYNTYMMSCDGLTQSASVALNLRVGTGGTPTYQASGYFYAYAGFSSATTAATGSSEAASSMQLVDADTVSTLATGSVNVVIWISNIPSSALYKVARWQTAYLSNTGHVVNVNGGGFWQGGSAAVTALRIIPASGTINAGQCTLFGVAP